MEVIRDIEKSNLYLIDNDKKILDTCCIGAEFVIILYTDKITITEDMDKYLYSNLLEIINNRYIFDNNGLSYQSNNEIRWFSDQCCNIDDERETEKNNRLIIKKIDNKISLEFKNPYLEKINVNRNMNLISFSPSYNGFYSRNIDTGSTFQDDFIIAFKNILNKKIDKNKVYTKK